MDERKLKEVEHSDRRRSIVRGHEYKTDSAASTAVEDFVEDRQAYEKHFSNMKFYSISRASFAHRDRRLFEGIAGKTVLDYCCGNGEIAVQMALRGARRACGIDLSPVAVENAKALAEKEGVADRCEFQVMDAENLRYSDSEFDVVHEYGALHHLDLNAAYRELSRVLKPEGRLVCTETMRHNPLIHWYRKSTMHLRTQWEVEHILGEPELRRGLEHFQSLDLRFFHLASLAAVPLRKSALFPYVLSALERVDGALLSLPLLQRWGWVAVAVFSRPRKARA